MEIEALKDRYKKKRIIIISVYAAIFVVLVLLVYLWIKPKATCFDGIKNQNEQGIDCGGVCSTQCENIKAEDLIVNESGLVDGGITGQVDAYGKITNPNNIFGSSEFQYEFKLKDSSGQVIASRQGAEFILPGESKYVVENNIEIGSGIPGSVEFFVSGAKWVEFKDYFEKPQLKVVNKSYNPITNGIGFSEATALLKNESPYDFSVIKLQVILKDDSGKPMALNSTLMNAVKAGENRDFTVSWPNKFPGSVGNMEVQPEVNIFNSEAFSQDNFKVNDLPPSNYR